MRAFYLCYVNRLILTNKNQLKGLELDYSNSK